MLLLVCELRIQKSLNSVYMCQSDSKPTCGCLEQCESLVDQVLERPALQESPMVTIERSKAEFDMIPCVYIHSPY